MIRNLLATTAVISIVSTSAFAAGGMNSSADEKENFKLYEFEVTTVEATAANGFLASNMIGKGVMNGETETAEEIGEINDVILGRDGSVQAVVIGVGGFLGIGEKEVALEFDRLSFMSKTDGEFDVTSDVTREELENAAAYERPDYVPNWMSMSSVREEMGKISDGVKSTYETVQTEAIDPAKKRIDQALNSWTAEKTAVDTATISSEALVGADVHTSQDSNIGEISQVLMNEEGQAEAVVIDVGGFLGFNAKPVAVSYDSLKLFETENGDLLVVAAFTKDELENAKTFEPAEYKSNPDALTLKG